MEEEEEEGGTGDGGEGEASKALQYVVGDVTQPQNAGEKDAIVLHCVGKGRQHHLFLSSLLLLLSLIFCCCYCCCFCYRTHHQLSTIIIPVFSVL